MSCFTLLHQAHLDADTAVMIYLSVSAGVCLYRSHFTFQLGWHYSRLQTATLPTIAENLSQVIRKMQNTRGGLQCTTLLMVQKKVVSLAET